MNEYKKADQLMDYTSADKWVHDLYTVVDGMKCNKLRQ